MKVTVCQLPEDRAAFERAWDALAAHVRQEHSELVLLPEMIFSPWLAAQKPQDLAAWDAAVAQHQRWLPRLAELGGVVVLGSAPVVADGKRLNEGFVWENGVYRAAHHKYYLPDEEGYWEAHWYARGDGAFRTIQTSRATVGFAICSELWFLEHQRAYGRQGAQIIAIPRATERSSVEKWLVGGQTAAVVSGAFSLSSNWDSDSWLFGGRGWIIDPDGQVLGVTSREQPFLTCAIDLSAADQAKHTYPRYIPE